MPSFSPACLYSEQLMANIATEEEKWEIFEELQMHDYICMIFRVCAFFGLLEK